MKPREPGALASLPKPSLEALAYNVHTLPLWGDGLGVVELLTQPFSIVRVLQKSGGSFAAFYDLTLEISSLTPT